MIKMELSIVIPAYNEEKNIEGVLRSIVDVFKRSNIDYEVLAVDNGSRDSTSKVIDLFKKNKRIKKISLKENQGYGGGILAGLHKAKGDIIGWIDGDKQTNAECLITVYKLARKNNGRGIFKVKRTLRCDGTQRKASSKLYNFMIRIIFGIDSNDINACPKLFGREVFNDLNIISKDWFIDTEVILKARRKGLPVVEIPAIFNKRKEGTSNVRWSISFEFLKNMIKYSLGKK